MSPLPASLFFREPLIRDYPAYKAGLAGFLHARNVLFVRKSVIARHMTVAEEGPFLAYRFDLVKDWIGQTKSKGRLFTFFLRIVLRRLGLKDLLNAEEINYLSELDEIAFTKGRSVKDLPVDFVKKAREVVGFHYGNVAIFQLQGKERIGVLDQADVYFTSLRVHFASDLFSFSIANKEIAQVLVLGSTIVFVERNGPSFAVVCEAPAVLKISFEKMARARRDW